MSDILAFLLDIIVNIIASVACTAVGFLASIFLNRYKEAVYKKKLSKALLIKTDGRNCPIEFDCYYANSGEYDSKESLFLGYPLEYMATASFRSYLQEINQKSNLYSTACPATVEEALKLNLRKNLMLMGGPFHNLITGLIFGLKKDYSNVPFYFDTFEGEEATLFFDNGNEILKFKPIYDNLRKCYVEDYGIIINIVNPFDKDKRIISFIGCRSIGTYGATTFYNINGDSFKKIAPYDEYVIIVKCVGDNDNLSKNPEFVCSKKLDSITTDKIKKEFVKNLEIKIK